MLKNKTSKKPRIVIVMPTYNEKGSIERMIDTLAVKIFPKIKDHEMQLLVVDGHSPDGTWKLVKEKAKKYPQQIFLYDEGGKHGLSAAYISGFNNAINKMHADGVMEMDADFQHDPEDIPRFLAEFDRGYDYIVGSRYVPGGSIPQEWTMDRKFLSVVGNLTYRIGLLMFDVHDFTTGYRLSRVNGFLDKMDLVKVFRNKSFTYKTFLLEEMKQRGAKIKEIPITFSVRTTGDSKMTTNNIIDSLITILVIWKRRFGFDR